MGSFDNDSELERRARLQAERTFEAMQAAYAAAPPVTALLQKMGIGAAGEVDAQLPEPGCELLLWRLRAETTLPAALPLVVRILSHPDFAASLPEGRDCPILVYQARRKWNEAAAHWAKLNNQRAQTWLRCDRRLLLQRSGQRAVLLVERRDLDVQFDAAAQKLVPVRQETNRPWQPERNESLLDWFPNLTVKHLIDGLRSPTRMLSASARSRGGADAYVHNAPLFVSNMEVFMHDNKKKAKDDKEDPNKGFVTWLSNTLRSANNK